MGQPEPTYRHEINGGYLWSPKRNANKARYTFYESMREVSPGDIIFSFRRELSNRIHPKSHIVELRGLLPQMYSPLRANGDGLQSV